MCRAVLAVSLLVLFSACLHAQPMKRPNVVVILADDQGWGDLAIHGNAAVRTPNLDQLARSGARFRHFFVQPVCSPTRAEFLTGRYHPRGGVWNVSLGGERLNPTGDTIADTFQKAGYATGCFGKWHNGTQYPYHALGQGFQEFYGFTSGHWGTYFDAPLDHNGQRVRSTGYLTDDLTTKAIHFIDANMKRPFFCYLPLNIPHSPMQVPDSYFERYKNFPLTQTGRGKEDIDHTRAALAMTENIDSNVGRLLAALEKWKLRENTIVVYFSDNGPNGWRWNGGMKGRKGSTDEGGVRSPLFISRPGMIPSDMELSPIAGAIDLLPTLAELARVPLIAKQPLDGVSLAAVVRGEKPPTVDRELFAHWNGRVSLRTQRYRLDADGKLFDMQTDPGQTRDVAEQFPEEAKRLRTRVKTWRDELLKNFKKDNRPFTVGHPAMARTELPARDGVPHGGVKRSANAPNDSFFTNWTKPEDRITWNIEVLKPGRFAIDLWHTCPAADVGSVVELRFGDIRLSQKVTDAHDPPLTGQEHDRVFRQGESYVKDFRPLRLGLVELPAGHGTLTLQATSITGRQVMDLQGLTLTREE